MTERKNWTIAYRRKHANRVVRAAELALTWQEAREYGDTVLADHPDLEVWVVARKGESGLDPAEHPMDDDHVLNNAGTKWLRMVEGERPAASGV